MGEIALARPRIATVTIITPMHSTILPVHALAANAEIIDGVSINVINAYRDMIRHGDPLLAIKTWAVNKHGCYVIDDGHHRSIALYLEGQRYVLACVADEPMQLSWRHPRILSLANLIPPELCK